MFSLLSNLGTELGKFFWGSQLGRANNEGASCLYVPVGRTKSRKEGGNLEKIKLSFLKTASTNNNISKSYSHDHLY